VQWTRSSRRLKKKEPYNFPKDDPTLQAACEALSHALQKASKDEAEHDTPEIKQALDNLRKAYDEAAKANTVVRNKSLGPRVLIVGKPGSGESCLEYLSRFT
jgi:hypothetical protein